MRGKRTSPNLKVANWITLLMTISWISGSSTRRGSIKLFRNIMSQIAHLKTKTGTTLQNLFRWSHKSNDCFICFQTLYQCSFVFHFGQLISTSKYRLLRQRWWLRVGATGWNLLANWSLQPSNSSVWLNDQEHKRRNKILCIKIAGKNDFLIKLDEIDTEVRTYLPIQAVVSVPCN